MLLDEYLPYYDVSEYHQTLVHGKAEQVYKAIRDADLTDSGLTRFLFRMRSLPGRLINRETGRTFDSGTIEGLCQRGFMLLAENPPQEMVLGAIGRFWKPNPRFIEIESESFRFYNRPGFAKVGWDLALNKARTGEVRLSTETRVRCLGLAARIRFIPYWLMIRPFSGLIRRQLLTEIKRLAEKDKEA